MAEQANPPDYYAILQVRPGAEPEVIGAAYHGLLTKYHLAADPIADVARKIVELKEAYEVLADPERRALYDAGRASGAAENQEKLANTILARSVSPDGSGGQWILAALFFVTSLWVPLWLAPDISNYLAAAVGSIASGDLPIFLLLWSWANILAAAFVRFGAGVVGGSLAVYGTSRIAPVRRLEVAGWAFGIVWMIAVVVTLRAANLETWIDSVSTLLLMAGAAFGAWYGRTIVE